MLFVMGRQGKITTKSNSLTETCQFWR